MVTYTKAKLQEMFTHLTENPPADRGNTSAKAFWAGFDGIKGVHYGKPDSFQRAAWRAGGMRDCGRNSRPRAKPHAGSRQACHSGRP